MAYMSETLLWCNSAGVRWRRRSAGFAVLAMSGLLLVAMLPTCCFTILGEGQSGSHRCCPSAEPRGASSPKPRSPCGPECPIRGANPPGPQSNEGFVSIQSIERTVEGISSLAVEHSPAVDTVVELPTAPIIAAKRGLRELLCSWII